MGNLRAVQDSHMSVQDHMQAAEQYLVSADQRTNDVSWSLVEAELAKAHLLAAAVKTAQEYIPNKGVVNVLSMVKKLAK